MTDHDSHTSALPVGYADFIKLCRVWDPKHFAGFEVRPDGVYVSLPSDDLILTPDERAVLTWRPTGNLTDPALRFPCTLGALLRFVEDSGLLGCIDPERLADWEATKSADLASEWDALTAQPEPDDFAALRARGQVDFVYLWAALFRDPLYGQDIRVERWLTTILRDRRFPADKEELFRLGSISGNSLQGGSHCLPAVEWEVQSNPLPEGTDNGYHRDRYTLLS